MATRCLTKLNELGNRVYVLAASCNEETMLEEGISIHPLPVVKAPAYRIDVLHKLISYVNDASGYAVSRKYFYKHDKEAGEKAVSKALRIVAPVFYKLGLKRPLEKQTERLHLLDNRSPETEAFLERVKADLVLITSPVRVDEPGIAGAAKRKAIPIAALITSFDNLTTKNHLRWSYNGYLLWSKNMEEELLELYPYSSSAKRYVTGAAQYDVFKLEKYQESKEEFCSRMRLDPKLPIISVALGSPNLIDELPGTVAFLEKVKEGAVGKVQIIVRPHPLFYVDKEYEAVAARYPEFTWQNASPKDTARGHHLSNQQIIDWVSTVRFTDVMVQLASTMAVDSCIADTPVVNINFDYSGKKDKLVKLVNWKMNHFAPLSNSGGLWMADNIDEVVEGVKAYLVDPTLHSEGRAWIAEFVAGYTDGKSGERIAQALHELASEVSN